jgi:hypothetical protein
MQYLTDSIQIISCRSVLRLLFCLEKIVRGASEKKAYGIGNVWDKAMHINNIRYALKSKYPHRKSQINLNKSDTSPDKIITNNSLANWLFATKYHHRFLKPPMIPLLASHQSFQDRVTHISKFNKHCANIIIAMIVDVIMPPLSQYPPT